MTASIKALVPLDLDNAVEVVLKVAGTAIDHTQITRALLVADGATLIDSAVSPAWFDWTDAARLVLKLGAAGLAAGPHRALLVTFDAAHPNGVYWDTAIKLNVIQVLP